MATLYYLDPADGTYKPYIAPGGDALAAPHDSATGRDAADGHAQTAVAGLELELRGLADLSAVAGKADVAHAHSYSAVTVSASAPAAPALGAIWIIP